MTILLPEINTLMTASVGELSNLIRSTKVALTELRPVNNDMSELNLKHDHVSPDYEMWEEAKLKLSPQAEMSTELNNRIGQSILEIMKALLGRTQYIAKLSLPLEERVAILPVPYHTKPIQEKTILDLSDELPHESVVWSKTIVDPLSQNSHGSFATMGGVRGALVCAGPVEVRSMFYHAEYARHHVENNQFPKAGSTDLTACQKRAEERLTQIQPVLNDPNLLVGLQFIYTNQGKLDWIPAVRKK